MLAKDLHYGLIGLVSFRCAIGAFRDAGKFIAFVQKMCGEKKKLVKLSELICIHFISSFHARASVLRCPLRRQEEPMPVRMLSLPQISLLQRRQRVVASGESAGSFNFGSTSEMK